MRRLMIHRCMGCNEAHYLPAWRDPRWCYRCALHLAPWRPVVFGQIRKVPRAIAARWDRDDQALAA